jgi:hypothetical protein
LRHSAEDITFFRRKHSERGDWFQQAAAVTGGGGQRKPRQGGAEFFLRQGGFVTRVPKVADEGVVIGTEKKKCPGREVGTTATGAGFICVRDSEFSAPALAAVVPLAERQSL